MGQEHKEYTWNLIAKNLTGEASTEELLELEALLRSNPELYYPMQTMADLWKASGPKEQKMAERAFNRHLDRMEELHIEYMRDDRSIESFSESQTVTGAGMTDLGTTSAGKTNPGTTGQETTSLGTTSLGT